MSEEPAAARGDGQDLLERLWPVVDPALDHLPVQELLEVTLGALQRAFGAPAAALVLGDGRERIGAPEDDPAWAAGPHVTVPLHDTTEEVGRLELSVPGGAVSPVERRALQFVAPRLGRLLGRRRSERMQGTVEQLHRIARTLLGRRGVADVVQYVTDEATAMTGAQFGAFFYNVVDAGGESYMLYTLSGAPREAFSRFPMPRNTAVFGPTFAGEAVVRSADITQDPRYGHNAPYHGMPEGHLPVRSYLALPVMARDGEVLGGLFFGHSDTGVFDGDAERAVIGIAALAALAIENERLHDAAQRELEASHRAWRERDQVARVLQESLLPPRLPQLDGLDAAAAYVPGSEVVGGDFYDLFPAGEAVLAAIGDVQGKDARAAARTSLVRHAVRLAAVDAAGPLEALRVVNRAALQEQDPADPRFSTLLLARLERHDGGFVARMASGGHPPAFVLRASGVVEQAACPGTLLGVLDEVEGAETSVSLATGDALVLYTDGLTEARQEAGILGEWRVRGLLRRLSGRDAAGIVEGLREASARWSRGRRTDDLALLVLRVTD